MIKYFILITIITFFSFPLMGNGISEPSDSAGAVQLREGVESFNEGNLQEAISLFTKAVNSNNVKIAAAAHYNHGTALAKAAESSEDQKEIPSILEAAYQSIKRAYLLNSLSKEEKINAQRNMQIIRERLSRLQNQDNQQEQDDKNQDSEESEKGESGEDSEENENGRQDEQNQNKSDVKNNEDNKQETDKDNKQDNEEEYAAQEAAEEQEMNDILDQERDNKEIRQILESKGGTYDIDKDW